jgi:hypothetical protein
VDRFEFIPLAQFPHTIRHSPEIALAVHGILLALKPIKGDNSVD